MVSYAYQGDLDISVRVVVRANMAILSRWSLKKLGRTLEGWNLATNGVVSRNRVACFGSIQPPALFE